MVKVINNKNCKKVNKIPVDLLANKRHITDEEKRILEENLNYCDDSWNNFYVDISSFDPRLIHLSHFSGFVILGKIENVTLNYNDLHLTCGIIESYLNNVVIGDYCSIRNVSYLDNYRIGDRVILFNIQEMCCTLHSKFGNGILKKGEEEEIRIKIGVANENDGRAILPFEEMLPSDAYLWSHYRDDEEILKRFKELTNYNNDGKLNTYGIVESDAVIKNCCVIKDAKIGRASYIKGAFKIKNITILSSEEEVSQVGEGVELVNGILGFGSRVFYQAIAVRFVIGRNCQVKYGARVLNSVLGDNSTVSCCEILNNLIFPFHEQHHNSSFLIATTIMGQSNIASGSTIGSNHNSRSADGEVLAKRGFWPGLCSDFKHNSRFASFVLVAKGSYQYELNITYPFSLVSKPSDENLSIGITPAWWFMYDMFAIMRNKSKFEKRDKRKVKVQHIEVDPFAPDTMSEVMESVKHLFTLIKDYLIENRYEGVSKEDRDIDSKVVTFIKNNKEKDIKLHDDIAQKRYGAVILKPIKGLIMYVRLLEFFAIRSIIEYAVENNIETVTKKELIDIKALPLYKTFENVGGQIIPLEKVFTLFSKIKENKINTWSEVHSFYDKEYENYLDEKASYSIYILEFLFNKDVSEIKDEELKTLIQNVKETNNSFYIESLKSREKDYKDYYRNMMYRNEKDKESVLGKIENNSFIKELKEETDKLALNMDKKFNYLTK